VGTTEESADPYMDMYSDYEYTATEAP